VTHGSTTEVLQDERYPAAWELFKPQAAENAVTFDAASDGVLAAQFESTTPINAVVRRKLENDSTAILKASRPDNHGAFARVERLGENITWPVLHGSFQRLRDIRAALEGME